MALNVVLSCDLWQFFGTYRPQVFHCPDPQKSLQLNSTGLQLPLPAWNS
jgi:hypothetical protein